MFMRSIPYGALKQMATENTLVASIGTINKIIRIQLKKIAHYNLLTIVPL